jgi:hypothetical protein
MARLSGRTQRYLGRCEFAALDTPEEFFCPGSYDSFDYSIDLAGFVSMR